MIKNIFLGFFIGSSIFCAIWAGAESKRVEEYKDIIQKADNGVYAISSFDHFGHISATVFAKSYKIDEGKRLVYAIERDTNDLIVITDNFIIEDLSDTKNYLNYSNKVINEVEVESEIQNSENKTEFGPKV